MKLYEEEQSGGMGIIDQIKRILPLFAAAVLASCHGGGSFAEEESWFRIENGMAQPVVRYTDAWRADYSNKDSDILRFVVYVETDYDTDLDGSAEIPVVR